MTGVWSSGLRASFRATRGFAGAVGNMEGTGAVNGDGVHAKGKLHGRAFYESLGSPKFVLAPMVDQSEFVSGFVCYSWS